MNFHRALAKAFLNSELDRDHALRVAESQRTGASIDELWARDQAFANDYLHKRVTIEEIRLKHGLSEQQVLEAINAAILRNRDNLQYPPK